MVATTYKILKKELAQELIEILSYWENHTIDNTHDGFLGRIDHYGTVIPKAHKGIILNTRILWSFAAASNHLKTKKYQHICERAFQYLKTYFWDKKHEGLFWELDYTGTPINKRKQVYAQAFGIYAFSEYYKFSNDKSAKAYALTLFNLLETHAKDTIHGGYIEAFNEDWTAIDDMRLSEKDMNASKTMNTHLHVLEAYTTLLQIHNNDEVREALKDLILLFRDKFLTKDFHYDLFFDTEWQLLSSSISFGHDIETAWLLIEAAKAVGDMDLLMQTKAIALQVAKAFLENGLDTDGAVMNEANRNTQHTDTDKHWWPQVEALVGLKYAFELSHDENYLDVSQRIWEFTKTHLKDPVNGEWHFRVDRTGKPYTNEDKVSMWKAPYHTSRACIFINSES